MVRLSTLAIACALAMLVAAPAAKAARIEAVVAGVPDPNNAQVGAEVSLRCRVVDDQGREMQRLPGGEPVADLGLDLVLDRGPANGFQGNLQGSSAGGTLTRDGLYVFRCNASNQSLAQGLDKEPGVVVARAKDIVETSVTLRTEDDFRPRTTFEVGETIRLQYRAFADDERTSLVRPVTTQVLVEEGEVDCSEDAPSAFEQFDHGPTDAWTDGDGLDAGIVERMTPRVTGQFTISVIQTGGGPNALCEAVTFEVVQDARPPRILVDQPSSPQLHWTLENFRVSGTIIDHGSANRSVSLPELDPDILHGLMPDGDVLTVDPESFPDVTAGGSVGAGDGLARPSTLLSGEGLEVTVSNGHWTDDAYVSDIPPEPGHFAFDAQLPWAPGLQVIEIVARDAAGHESRTLTTVYAGTYWLDLQVDPPSRGEHNTIRTVVLEPGRTLIHDNEPPIDSLNEIAHFGLPLLEAWGNPRLPGPAHIDREILNSFWQNVENLLRPSFDVAGAVVPGRPEFMLLPAADKLEFVIRLPLSGQVVMQCQGPTVSLNRLLCRIAGQPDGRFHVNVGGFVDIEWRFRPQTAGGLSLRTDLNQDLEIVDYLLVENGLDNDPEINAAFRDEILTNVRNNVDRLIRRLWGCLDDRGEVRDNCAPSEPFQVHAEDHDEAGAIPQLAAIELFGGKLNHIVSFETSHPAPDTGTMTVTIPFRFERMGVDNSRIHANLSASAYFAPVGDPPDHEGVLLDQGSRDDDLYPPPASDMLAWFGSGNRDLQGAVHVHALNQALAQLWASRLHDLELPLFDVLDNAGFFSQPVERSLAEMVLAGSTLKVSVKAPPRLAFYDGAPALHLETGALELEFDFTKHFDSRLVLEVALVAQLEVEQSEDGEGLTASFNDPTGCEPTTRRFMSCDGRFEVAVVERQGLHEWTPRPDLLQGDDAMDRFLTLVGAKDENGTYRSPREFEAFYARRLSDVVSGFLQTAHTIDLPDLELPKIDFGDVRIAPIDLTNFRVHEDVNGGGYGSGWLAFALDLNGRTSAGN